MIEHLLSYAFYIGPSACLPVLPKTFCQRLKMLKVQNAMTPIPQRVILPNLFHQQLNLPEQNTNHSNKDITWSTPGHDWQNGWKTIYVVSTCRDWRFYQSCSFLIWWLICFFSCHEYLNPKTLKLVMLRRRENVFAFLLNGDAVEEKLVEVKFFEV